MDDGFSPKANEVDVNLPEQGGNDFRGDGISDNYIKDFLEETWDQDHWQAVTNRYRRELVGQSGLETLRALAADPKNAASLLQHYTAALYSDDERVRCEVIEYVPPLAFLLSEEGSNGELQSLISSHLLPMVTRALDDDNSQVVNMAESSLLSLLKHCLISSENIEHTVWPVIQSRISKRESVDGNIVVQVIIVSILLVYLASQNGCEMLIMSYHSHF